MIELSEELARASTMLDLRRFGEASELLARVVSAEPESSRAWCLMARAHLGGERYTEAISAANQAVSLDPSDEWPHRLASVALSRMGVHDEAAGEAQAALQAARQTPATFANSAVSLARPRIVTPYGSRTGPYAAGRRRAA